MVMLPALTVFGDCVGIAGGWIICTTTLDFNTPGYIIHAVDRAGPWDLFSGIIKSIFFAWLIITIACQRGLEVEGGAEGVGHATTESVVWSILIVLIANAVLTGIFFFTE
jgi:phospholipid/cholesterol/gamma-HCH transport system permease protein